MSAWTRESCIAAVQAFHERHGYQPVSNEATRHHGLPSWPAVKRLFGSWNALIVAAGFRPYPARSSAQAKTLAHRDRHAAWTAAHADRALGVLREPPAGGDGG